MSAICPECESDIDIDETDVDVGDELTCSECGSLLRIVNDAPVEFEVADDDDLDEEDEEKDDEEEKEEDVEDDDEELDEDEDEDGYSEED